MQEQETLLPNSSTSDSSSSYTFSVYHTQFQCKRVHGVISTTLYCLCSCLFPIIHCPWPINFSPTLGYSHAYHSKWFWILARYLEDTQDIWWEFHIDAKNTLAIVLNRIHDNFGLGLDMSSLWTLSRISPWVITSASNLARSL